MRDLSSFPMIMNAIEAYFLKIDRLLELFVSFGIKTSLIYLASHLSLKISSRTQLKEIADLFLTEIKIRFQAIIT